MAWLVLPLWMEDSILRTFEDAITPTPLEAAPAVYFKGRAMEQPASSERVRILDTTLRDGEQSPGASMGPEEKLEMALQLEVLGVDVLEAGFPSSSPAEFESVRRIAEALTHPVVACLARVVKKDIEIAREALGPARRARCHVFVATSEIHMTHKLRKSPAQVLELAVEAVRHARERFEDVEFSAEDATRTDPGFLAEIVAAVVDSGATTVNLPDTVGYALPADIVAMFHGVRERVPNIDRAILSAHCHDDLGLAVANSLAAIEAGARQVECTVNGIGERAGNAALEEIVMAMHVRGDRLKVGCGIDTRQIYTSSRLLRTITGLCVQRNKAIVGANAFAHESGIHQDGMLKNPLTYEIMTPGTVGRSSSELVLGKHSGRHALLVRCVELGYQVDGSDLDRVYSAFKGIADRKREVGTEDLIAILGQEGVKAAESR